MIPFFYSLITFIIGLFFVMVGLLGFSIQASTSIRTEVVSFIFEDTVFISLFGILSLLMGIAIIFSFITSFKKRSFKIKSKNNNTFALDESLFQDYIKNYWRQLFPKHDIPSQVTLKKNKVLISADLPYVPDSQQKALLGRIDRDLKDLLTRVIGYPREYVVSISFQSEVNEQPVLQK